METSNVQKKLSRLLLFLLLALCACSGVKENPSEVLKTGQPEELYGQLFYDVQSNDSIFPDNKTFVDAIPLIDPGEIRSRYTQLSDRSTSRISDFLNENFKVPGTDNKYISDSSSIDLHISRLWDDLRRPADDQEAGTLIALPKAYIVPGGRFREVYYWDSYFTMLGLQVDGRDEEIEDMINNFAYLIDQFGHIPNGNRTYYLSRSQPPFFAVMLSLLAQIKGDHIYTEYMDNLRKEYDFWMYGADEIQARTTAVSRRVVKLPGGEVLNRYWDNVATPRPEGYRVDIEIAQEAIQKTPDITKSEIYRNLRAAAESGWDFSSRWLAPDPGGTYRMKSIRTTHIVPVDLNALLYNLECTIAKAYAVEGDIHEAQKYQEIADTRRAALNRYCWDGSSGFFRDYDFNRGKMTEVLSLAAIYPLFFNMANQAQADQIAVKIQTHFLKEGGVVTTLHDTGQQWDYPNGWAPLQWLTIKGLRNYGHNDLADEIKHRWLSLNKQVYNRTFKLTEKYNVTDLSLEGGGGEYPNQDGFGWTNGVFKKLSTE